jgi:hypothetical protein
VSTAPPARSWSSLLESALQKVKRGCMGAGSLTWGAGGLRTCDSLGTRCKRRARLHGFMSRRAPKHPCAAAPEPHPLLLVRRCGSGTGLCLCLGRTAALGQLPLQLSTSVQALHPRRRTAQRHKLVVFVAAAPLPAPSPTARHALLYSATRIHH